MYMMYEINHEVNSLRTKMICFLKYEDDKKLYSSFRTIEVT